MDAPDQNPAGSVPAQGGTEGDDQVAQNESPLVPVVVAEPQVTPPGTQDNNSIRRLRKVSNLRKAGVFWLEIGTFVALIAYATISKNAWQESILATKPTQEAATQAKRSADEAHSANEVTRDALEEVQRAFVAPGAVENIPIGGTTTQSVRFNFHWDNSGRHQRGIFAAMLHTTGVPPQCQTTSFLSINGNPARRI